MINNEIVKLVYDKLIVIENNILKCPNIKLSIYESACIYILSVKLIRKFENEKRVHEEKVENEKRVYEENKKLIEMTKLVSKIKEIRDNDNSV